jgi:deazaflavin-dependent oxidoreductase (nitroreductase family)
LEGGRYLTIQIHEERSSIALNRQNQYLRIETIGRKTGKPHYVLLRFITVGDKIMVFPQNQGKQDWVSNLRVNSKAKLYTRTAIFSCTAKIQRINGTSDPVLPLFTRKYGLEVVRDRYWGQRTYVELDCTKVEAGNLVDIVYDDIEAAFDGVAEHYDRHILGNPINTWLRNISIGTLQQLFRPGSTVLEIGCGTGTETLKLARHGITVVACDISGKMLEVLERKAKLEGLDDRVFTLHCRASGLKKGVSSLGFDKFDGAYSTYGAINTEPRLNDLFRDLHDLLKDDGILVLGVWNKYCLYEILGYLSRGRPGLAFARLRNPVPIGKSRFCLTSNAYSISSLGKYAGSFFKLKSILGVVIILPPSNLTRYLPKGRWLSFFARLDLRLGRTFPFNRLGDHFLAVYTARGGIQN